MIAQAQRPRKPAPIPMLAPPRRQLALPVFDYIKLARKVDALRIGDALVFYNERLEYVSLVSGGYYQLRLYRADRIIAAAYVRDEITDTLKAEVVSVLFWQRQWTSECRLECDAAWGRRRTRRTFAKAG